MWRIVSELVDYHDLLFMLAWRDIKIRYKQSIMGFLWAILMPALITAAGVLVRLAFSFTSGRTLALADVASVALKSLPWAFFVSTIRFATNSITSNINLVTKIYFPREVFPLSSTLAGLFDLLVASPVVVLILAVTKVKLSVHLFWLPVLLVLMVIWTAGLGMFLSCANLFFRDVKYLVEVFLTIGVLFTPVFYEARTFGKWAPLLLLNPIGVALEMMNDVVVRHSAPDYAWLAYLAAWAVLGFLIAWKVFDQAEASFAENI